MPRRPKICRIPEQLNHINRQLENFAVEYSQMDLRSRVGKLVEVRHSTDDLGVSVLHDSIVCEQSARARIAAYLIANEGFAVQGDELAVVSGISEYGRRVRELRVEAGYHIFTGASSDSDTGIQLRPDQYLLASSEPDDEAPRRWHVANRIRKMKGAAKTRLLAYFQENVLRVVTTEELRYVAKAADFQRRIRELRTEEGYAIATLYTGRPDLGPGEYMLLDANRVAEPHDRRIPVDVQRAVFERDSNTCQQCGWVPSDWTADDPRMLELHHLQEHAARGQNIDTNLVLLCTRCHDGVHAGRLVLRPKP